MNIGERVEAVTLTHPDPNNYSVVYISKIEVDHKMKSLFASGRIIYRSSKVEALKLARYYKNQLSEANDFKIDTY